MDGRGVMNEDEIDADEGAAERAVGQRSPKQRLRWPP